MKHCFVLLMIFIVAPFALADPIDEVRNAEIGFAKAFAERNREKFFSFVADDATFLSAGRTMNGKPQVVQGWSRFFEGPTAPFEWGPERVVVNAAGTIGFSTGPIFDASGTHIGSFNSTWRKESDGSWKVLFDGPGSAAACLPETAAKIEEGYVTADDGLKLHYRKVGRAPLTIIMPLGFIVFDDFKTLADIATLITYDMRNRGRSDRVEKSETLTIHQDVKDLEAVRRHFNVDKFVPAGYSYLGLMVAMYALDHPQRVSRIIQLGPVAIRFDTEFPKGLTHGRDDMGVSEEEMKAYREARAAGAAEKTPRAFCEQQEKIMSRLLVGNPAHASRIASQCHLENEWPVNFARHIEHHFGSVKALKMEKSAFTAIKVPVLTIHGTKDRNAPYGAGREWAMTLPDARLVTVHGAAHSAWSDDPVTVFTAIREFLRGNWPRTAEKITSLVP